VTGRLDAFEWKVPVAELGAPAPLVIEAPAVPAPAGAPAELPREIPSPPLGNVTAEVAPRTDRPAPRPAPIVPLAQIPDDPGPEGQLDPDADLAETEPKPDPWQRFRQFFR
jgi:HemY protein